MYNYLFSSCASTLILISACTSECKSIFTLKVPSDLISFMGCINEGLISIFSFSLISLEISVGFIDPYKSLFSVTNFFIA